MMKEFTNELDRWQNQAWERKSFARAVKVLSNIERECAGLCSKGLTSLFNTNFSYWMERLGLQKFFEKLNGKSIIQSAVQSLDDPASGEETEKRNLETLFNQYQPDDQEPAQDQITAEEKSSVQAFLLFWREKSLK